jgi:hypothetical protein
MKTAGCLGGSYTKQTAVEIPNRLMVRVNLSGALNYKGQLAPTLAMVSP